MFTGEKIVPLRRTYGAGIHEETIGLEGGSNTLKASGVVSGDGTVSIHAYVGGRRILVYERAGISPNEVKVVESGSPRLDVKLDYAGDSRWDVNDNGVAGEGGVVDFTIIETNIDDELTLENICSEWMVYSEENQKMTSTCYGSMICCKMLGFAGLQESRWYDRFHLHRGKMGATKSNIVGIQVVYAELGGEKILSNVLHLPARFENLSDRFEDECVESCRLIGDENVELVITVDEESSLYLEDIKYFT